MLSLPPHTLVFPIIRGNSNDVEILLKDFKALGNMVCDVLQQVIEEIIKEHGSVRPISLRRILLSCRFRYIDGNFFPK